MAAQIEIQRHQASFDGQRWRAADPRLEQLCQDTARLLPHAYYPDPVGDPARAVAAELRGRVLHVDPVAPDDAPEDAQY